MARMRSSIACLLESGIVLTPTLGAACMDSFGGTGARGVAVPVKAG
jgi:hypothetical protein